MPPRRNPRSSRRPRHSRRPRRSPTPRAGRTLIALTALGHIAVLALLHTIGPPPLVRIDVLWVNDHRTIVQTISIIAASALALSILSLPMRKARWITLALWTLSATTAWMLFSDRLTIIIPIVIRHAL